MILLGERVFRFSSSVLPFYVASVLVRKTPQCIYLFFYFFYALVLNTGCMNREENVFRNENKPESL